MPYREKGNTAVETNKTMAVYLFNLALSDPESYFHFISTEREIKRLREYLDD
jgi:hypothetical protein